jgi:multimeric flavodoxin WrbA
MSKKVLILFGSPRKHGNTATICGWAADGIREQGSSVKVVDVARLNFKAAGCLSCYACQQSEDFRCIIRDEVSDLIASIPDYDMLVLATPVYFFGFSAQLKQLLDRMFSLYKFKDDEIIHPLHKLQFGLISCCGGDTGSGLDLVDATVRKIAGLTGKKHQSLLIPFAPHDPATLNDNLEIKEKAVAFGASLVQ